MKKIFILIAVTLTICSTIFAQSRQISEQEALTVALNRLKKDYPAKTVMITGVSKKNEP